MVVADFPRNRSLCSLPSIDISCIEDEDSKADLSSEDLDNMVYAKKIGSSNGHDSFFETFSGSISEDNGVAAPELQQNERIPASLETSNYQSTSSPVSILGGYSVGFNIYSLEYSCEMEQNENPGRLNVCGDSENHETTKSVNEMSVMSSIGTGCSIETSTSYLGIPDDAIMTFLPNTDKEGRKNNLKVIDQPNCKNNGNGLKALDGHNCESALQDKIGIQSTDSETDSIIDEYLSHLNDDEDILGASSPDMNSKHENVVDSKDVEMDMLSKSCTTRARSLVEQEVCDTYKHMLKDIESIETGVEKDDSNTHGNSDDSDSCARDDKDSVYQSNSTDAETLLDPKFNQYSEDGFDQYGRMSQDSEVGNVNQMMDQSVSHEDVNSTVDHESKADVSEEKKGEVLSWSGVGNVSCSIHEPLNQCKEIKTGNHCSQESSKENEANVLTAVDDHRGNNSLPEDSHNVLEKWSELSDVDSVGFSGPLAFSGVISYSGMLPQVPYSGNISYRSDSSTSTRSFAFPTMAHEWNSSPAKIGPPDSRYFPRRRRWQTYFSCCKRPTTLFD